MPLRTKIALYESSEGKTDRFFSLKLRANHCVESTEYTRPSRILVISNLPGNFEIFKNLLLRAGLMNSAYEWIFKEGHLVIMGSSFLVDKICPECLWLIYSLEEKARRKGGYIHFILGENEINSINGDWQYTHPNYAKPPASAKHSYAVLYDGNRELKRWLYTKNILEKLGNIIISQTDISAYVSLPDTSLAELNNSARQYYFRNNGFAIGPNKIPNYKLKVKKVNKFSCIFASNELREGDRDESRTNVDILFVVGHRFYKIDTEWQWERIKL